MPFWDDFVPPKEPGADAQSTDLTRWAGQASAASARSQFLAALVTIGMLLFTLWLLRLAVRTQKDTSTQIGLLKDQVEAATNQQKTLEAQLIMLSKNQEVLTSQLSALNKNQEILRALLKPVLLAAQPLLLVNGKFELNSRDPNRNSYWIEIRNDSENVAEDVVVIFLVLRVHAEDFEELCEVPCGRITADKPVVLKRIHLKDYVESGFKEKCGARALTEQGRISAVRAYCKYKDKLANVQENRNMAVDITLTFSEEK